MKQEDHYVVYIAEFQPQIVLMHVQILMKQQDHCMAYSAKFY